MGLLGLPVGLYLFGVLLQVGREATVARRIANKIKVIRLSGSNRSLERGDTRVGDGPGWQTGMFIGVIE